MHLLDVIKKRSQNVFLEDIDITKRSTKENEGEIMVLKRQKTITKSQKQYKMDMDYTNNYVVTPRNRR